MPKKDKELGPRLPQATVDKILRNWPLLNEHIMQLNEGEVEQLMDSEIKRPLPRMNYVLRIHSRLTKLGVQRMNMRRLALMDFVNRKHGKK